MQLKHKEDKKEKKVEIKEEKKETSTDETNGDKKEEIDKEKEPEKEEDTEKIAETVHCMRIGWSCLDTSLQLGETPYSYGFDNGSYKVHDTEFIEYGKKFEVGDVIGAFLVSIFLTKINFSTT